MHNRPRHLNQNQTQKNRTKTQNLETEKEPKLMLITLDFDFHLALGWLCFISMVRPRASFVCVCVMLNVLFGLSGYRAFAFCFPPYLAIAISNGKMAHGT